MLLGRTAPFLTETVLADADIYTVSFGDNTRFYLRGQLTLLRNSELLNNLWRRCRPLANLSARVIDFVDHPEKYPLEFRRRLNGWKFESAEGCISKAAFDTRGIRVVAAPVLSSDAYSANATEKEAMVIGPAVVRCYGGPMARGEGRWGLPRKMEAALSSSSW